MWWLVFLMCSPISWAKAFGGTSSDDAWTVQQTSDSGYIAGGETHSYGGGYDFLVIRLNSTGDVIWGKVFGGTGDERAWGVLQTSDGGYIVVGETSSWVGQEDMMF